jgi:hypothetical protein
VAWRKVAAAGPAAGAVAELLAHERDCAAAAAAGDARAAELLVSARSWVAMLRASGNDPEVAEFLAVFAREDGHGVA